MILSTQYYSFLVSRVLNNHCKLCGHYDPSDELLITYGAERINYNWNRCPSCGRTVKQFFLEEGLNFIPKEVEKEHQTKPESSPEKMKEMGHPKNPTDWYDPNWLDKYEWNPKVFTAPKYGNIPKPKPIEKDVDISTLKTVKIKIKLGGK